MLPGNDVCAAHPFSGFVVNLNVTTRGHRDAKDWTACLVLVLGDHTGGELVLVEPGIVIPLHSGDLIVFPSMRLTHFNMHYKGTRASLVLHSDRAGHKWVVDGNEWQDHGCMC